MEGTPFGRYRLLEPLGRGGMGEVWKAYDTTMKRMVAMKVLPPNFADDEEYQVRFRREAHAAAGLDEPHVVPIHDFGEIDGRLYVTMRLIDGRTVQQLLADGPLDPERAVWIVEQIAAALGAAHAVGLVHRDVKPANILVTADDFAYLIDFGIARADGETKLTHTGATIGTVAYMAPERFTSDRADARSDIYALTCVLHECLTGSQPFPGDSMERQISGHLTMAPPRPSLLRPGISTQMDQVIAIGMAKDPAQRYASARDLATAARAALAPPAWAPPAAPAWAPTPPQGSEPTVPNVGRAPQWWRNPAAVIVGGLVGVCVIVAAVVIVLIWPEIHSRPDPVAANMPDVQQIPSSSAPMAGTETGIGLPAPPRETSMSAAPGPGRLQTADGLSQLVGTIRTEFGDTTGFSLVVYADYAILDRADPHNSHVDQSYMYRGGGWSAWGSRGSADSMDHLADLGGFDATGVATTLAGAPPTLGAPAGSGTYLIIEGNEGGGLDLAVHSTEPGTGYMQVNADGTVGRIYPP